MTAFEPKRIDRELAGKVYDVLMETCSAPACERESFIDHYINPTPSSEWRFCGALGFGGKFRSPAFRVDCYPEDETPARREMISKANEQLAGLKPE